MPNSKSLITQELRKIKEAKGLTNEGWAKLAGITVSSVNRYLSSSLNVQNFPFTCAMLRAADVSIDEFYDRIASMIDVPADALKLDTIPAAEVIGCISIDTPESKAAVQERIIVQTEEMQAQQARLREKDAQIELLEARLEMYERLLEEKERLIDKIETISRSRLDALKTLCAAQ